ncbi:hypothetical protein BUZ14_12680 [Staphylococcus gallinarum]|uniref:Uncharacterized protein n=1 Tax=Staphylococcus gallinarum TaxID=1293 RepID=A0A3A0VGJ0_STAGA|nr:hypothetical protein [Staphylococcus gallinarum]RIP32781.1 hypothetical protein BUZ14_12680 [Staphylococcus gallinarum]
MNNEKRLVKKKGMKVLATVLLLWTIVSIVLAGALDIKYANYILLGVWILIVIICFFIDKYIEKNYMKKHLGDKYLRLKNKR